MNKLPVFTTIGQTFGFVVERRFFTLLRLVWFPSLIAMIVSLLPAIYTYSKLSTLPNQPRAASRRRRVEFTDMSDPTLVLLEVLNIVGSIVLSAIIAVSHSPVDPVGRSQAGNVLLPASQQAGVALHSGVGDLFHRDHVGVCRRSSRTCSMRSAARSNAPISTIRKRRSGCWARCSEIRGRRSRWGWPCSSALVVTGAVRAGVSCHRCGGPAVVRAVVGADAREFLAADRLLDLGHRSWARSCCSSLVSIVALGDRWDRRWR